MSQIREQLQQYMGRRFDATPLPADSGDMWKDNEALTQWYLESAFFRDFVYRNPYKAPGKEFSDALIVFDDTLIIVQNKTQQSGTDPLLWARKNVNDALRQLRGSYRNLKDGLVTSFVNEFVGSRIEVKIDDYTTVFGVIVLAHEGPPYDPYPMLQSAHTPDCPFTILSLEDLLIIADRMDTAANLITYFEYRFDCMSRGFRPRVNDELANMEHIAGVVPEILRPHFRDLDREKQEASIGSVVKTLRTRVKDHPEYALSTLVDDAIARAHDTDPEWTRSADQSKIMAHEIATRIGWLDRVRRIMLGKRLLAAAVRATSAGPQIVTHIQKPRRQMYLWIFTAMAREDRKKLLELLSTSAQIKYGFDRVLGVVTEPANGRGRSYDFWMADENVIAVPEEFPEDVFAMLPDLGNMTNIADEL